MGEQGWRSGDRTHLPPMWPGFESWTGCHKWVEFVVGSRPCSKGFSPDSPVFLPPQKSTFLNSIFDREFEGHGFVSGMTVMCYRRKTMLIIIIIMFSKQLLILLRNDVIYLLFVSFFWLYKFLKVLGGLQQHYINCRFFVKINDLSNLSSG